MAFVEGDVIVCPNFDGIKWGCEGVCRVVRNWNVRGDAPSGCTPQDQKDFTDFHGAVHGITENCGLLFGYFRKSPEINERLSRCCCPSVTKDAGTNRELRRVQAKINKLKALLK